MVNLMRYLLALSLGLSLSAATVSNVRTDQLTHSTMRVLFDVTGSYSYYRVRYIASPGTCSGGSGGALQINGQAPSTLVALGQKVNISGLAPNTTYNVCPEVSADNVMWSSGVSASFTTLVLPSPHPALPIAPTTFDTSYPNTSGYTVVTTAGDCSDLQAKINAAVANQLTAGQVIQIPAGSVCLAPTTDAANSYWTSPIPPDVKTFTASNINAGTGLITIPSHGFTNNQEVRLATDGCLPGSAGGDPFCQLRGILKGEPYYAQVVDANNFYLMNAPSSTPIVFSDPGSGNQYIAGYPRALNPLIIRTSTADAVFTPAGVRTNPAWVPKMATLKLTTVGASYHNTIFSPGLLGASIRFVGIEFTHGDNSAEANTTTDPQPWNGLFVTSPDASNIVIDRCYLHGLGYPNRLYRAIYNYDGHNMAIINSYLSNLDYWHPIFTGLGITRTSSTQFTIAPGTHHMGVITPVLPNTVTINFSGAGTGAAMVYFDMSGTFTVNFSPSITPGSCTGTTCTILNTLGETAFGSCNQGDAWPKNANGRTAAGEIACVDIVSGAITTVQNADAFSSADATEGAQSFIAGYGPGPFMIQNNWISGSGIVMHFDDSGTDIYTRGDYTVQRNTFNVPLTEMFGGPISNGLRYGHRQTLEWKGGQRMKIDGNIFDGGFSEDTHSSVMMEIGSVNQGNVNDADVTNNTYQHGPGGLTTPLGVDAGGPMKPSQRTRVQNNLFWDLNGYVYYTVGAQNPATGWIIQGGYANADITINHNTAYDNRGVITSFFYWIESPLEGLSVTNNFIFYSDSYLFRNESFPTCASGDKAFMDCAFTSGPGNPSYTLAGNVIVPSWTDSSGPTGQQAQSTVQGYYSGMPASNSVMSSSLGGVPQTVASVGWFNSSSGVTPDFHLKSSSAYISGGANRGTDGRDVGADIDALQAAQGKVTLTGVSSITTNSAIVTFVALDGVGCTVDYSSSDPTVVSSFTRVANAVGAGVQNVMLSSLATGTTYHYRVNCAVEQPMGQFRTN